MIFVFGSAGKAGCSEIATKFAEEHGYTIHSGGRTQRKMAFSRGLVTPPDYEIPNDPDLWTDNVLEHADLNTLREICFANGEKIDLIIDRFLLFEAWKAATTGKSVVIDSKLFARLQYTEACLQLLAEVKLEHPEIDDPEIALQLISKNTNAFWIHADIETRATRSILKRREELAIKFRKEGETIEYSREISTEELDTEMQQLIIRQEGNIRAFSDYGVYDYPSALEMPPHTFGTIIDNSQHTTVEETYAMVRSYV